MSFNKRYISKESIVKIAEKNLPEVFFSYFSSNAIICKDEYSSKILSEIRKMNIYDKDKIINIMKSIEKNK